MKNATRDKITAHYKVLIREYVKSVLENKRAHSRLEYLMVARSVKDREKGEWLYDEREALLPLVWIALVMRFPYGENKSGKPMLLEGWQAFIISELFGWYNKEKTVRRFRDAYIEVPRKNGKSTFIGAICAYMAFSKKENDGSPCYVGATSLDQASEVFRRIARGLYHHRDVEVSDSKNNKVIK